MAELERIRKITDPAERARELGAVLADLPKLSVEAREMRQAAVLEMRAADMTFAEIGAALGLHRNRVQQIAEGR